jgi:hypothetical protein
MLKIKRDTFLKSAPTQSTELSSVDLLPVKAGESFQLEKYFPADNHHWSVILSKGLLARNGKVYQSWYVFRDHVEIEDGTIDLPVPYITQLEAFTQPHRVCNTACSVMCLQYFGKKITLNEALQRLSGDTTDHAVQTRLISSLGIQSSFHYNLTFNHLDTQLKARKPIIIGILHRGTDAFPTGGHMVVVRGKDARGRYIVNDPYGDIHNGYADAAKGDVLSVRRVGNGVRFERGLMQARWQTRGQTAAGWGRLF